MTYLNNDALALFSFFEMTPDLVCIAGKDGFFRKVNQSVIKKLGYTEQEIYAAPISTFIHPEDQAITASRRKELLEGKALVNFENRYITRHNEVIWLHWTSVFIPDKEVVFAIARDITQRKQEEKQVEEKFRKFRSLATHFKTTIERERKYLAIELHEELAQLAAVVKMDLGWVRVNTPYLPEGSMERLNHALAVADLLIDAIRRISYSISPRMLEDLGLQETLRWLCEEFSVLNGIPCKLEVDYDTAQISQEIQMDFFRICQEALSNITYHAAAGSVTIRIATQRDNLVLTITDNGKGFEPAEYTQTAGITSMQERASSVNGHLHISSKPGKGTTVKVEVPLQEQSGKKIV